MALARWQATITDGAGNVIVSPNIEVRRDIAGAPIARIYSDRDGATPLANPFVGGTDGLAAFHARGGAYRVRAYKDGFEQESRYVGVGTYQEADQTVWLDPGYLYEFWTATTGDPTGGLFRANNADLSLATQLIIHKDTRGAFDIGARLLALAPGNKIEKNTISIAGIAGGGATFVVDAASDGSTFVTLTVSGHTGDTSLSGDLFALQTTISGGNGAAATIAVGDVDTVAYGQPATVTNVGTSAAAEFDFEIPLSAKGWSPQLVTEADGERTVLKLAGYVGGEGTAPTANVGEYLKADGTFTATIGDALDVTGKSFNWLGAYNGATAYAKRDVTRDQGASWIALQATTGNAPPTRPTAANAYWELMVDKGADGLGTGDVVGPASATDGAIVLFDGVGGKLIKNGAVTIIDEDDMSSDSASAVPTQQSTKAYVDAAVAGIDLTQIEEHDLVISQILLKLADIENSAEFMGPAGNWVADSFDALTYVDTVNSSNLDTSQAGVLKPAIAAGTSTMSVTLPSTTAQPLITFRNVFAPAAISESGAFVRAKFQGPATGSNPKNWANSFIGHAAASGDAYDFDGNQVRLTFGGANGVTPPVGGFTWSDWVALAVDETKALVVAIEGATSQDTKAAASLGANYNAYYKEALDASTINATGYTLVSGNVIAISDLEVKSSIAPANATVPLGAFPASVAPTKMKALLLVEETDAATAGTDYQLRVSRNNKTNWTSATLTERGSAGAGMIWVETDTVDVSGQPTGTQIWGEWKTLNNKNVKLHGWKLYWGN